MRRIQSALYDSLLAYLPTVPLSESNRELILLGAKFAGERIRHDINAERRKQHAAKRATGWRRKHTAAETLATKLRVRKWRAAKLAAAKLAKQPK